MSRGVRFLVGGAFVLHGLAHTLPGMRALGRLAGWPVADPETGSVVLVALGTVLWAASAVGLTGAGFGIWGVRPLTPRWPRFAAVGAGSSILLLTLFRPEHALLGVVLSAVALPFVWKWGGGPGLEQPAGFPGRAIPGRRIAELVAVLALLYMALGLPSDQLEGEPVRYGIQHAVTVHAPADEVWPWLVQIGQDRAGFYSYDTRGGGPGTPTDLVFAPAGLRLFEIAHFVMERRMLLGIKEPAERAAGVPLGDLTRAAFGRHLDRRVPEWMERQGVPGATILLVQDGAPVWSRSYGWADRDAERPLDVGTVMMTHSISKSVTAWGVMHLVEEGRIGLDDPVRRHLPDWRPSAGNEWVDRITVRHLLSHTSGLPLGPVGVHYEPGEEIPALAVTLTGSDVRVAREPGAGFEYSNLGYGLLEWLVEEVTGRDFGEFMRTEVLGPLGMVESTFDWDETLHGDMPTGYDLRGAPVPPYAYPFRASGALLSTAEDLGRFVAAGMMGGPGVEAGNPVLGPASVKEMYRSQARISGLFAVVASDYGLGHFLEELSDGRRVAWHGGQGLGWMTHFHSVPETGDGIVILTNSQRSWPLFALILRDWAEWRGFAPVGMGRIAAGRRGMQGVVALVLLAALGWAWRLARGVAAGHRRLGWFVPGGEWRRGGELVVGLALTSGLVWAVRQDYLYVSSIFPTTAVWLGWSLAALAAALLASAFFPSTETPIRPRGGAP